MSSRRPFEIRFPNGHAAQAVEVHQQSELTTALRDLGLEESRRTLVVVGGAAGLRTASLGSLNHLFVDGLAPLAQELGTYVVDGATDSGVIQLMGIARSEIGGTFPLIGVAAIGTVSVPSIAPPPRDVSPLEPNHSHFVLVPGIAWGDEVPWISQVANLLTNGAPSVSILINGGQIAWDDVEQSVKDRRPVVVIGGSGRTANALAEAVRGEPSSSRANGLVASGLLRVIDLADCPRALFVAIKDSLSVGEQNG